MQVELVGKMSLLKENLDFWLKKQKSNFSEDLSQFDRHGKKHNPLSPPKQAKLFAFLFSEEK